MGQANKRGTFEQRKKIAINKKYDEAIRKDNEAKEKLRLERERWESLSPEEKEKEIELQRKKHRDQKEVMNYLYTAMMIGSFYNKTMFRGF